MALDHELPVWSIAPNWQEPVIEVLEWFTDVLTSGTGAEQRMAMRLAPRRTLEARYAPMENERTFADLALHRLGRSEWMVPLWFDCATLTASAVAGATALAFDTAFHEFAAGGMAYLVGSDAFSGEAVRIAAVNPGELTLSVPLDRAWAAGAKLHPMRRGRCDSSGASNVTSRITEAALRFVMVEGNDLSAEGAWATLHAGIPVIDTPPEWSESVDLDLSWLGETFDSTIGRTSYSDGANRGFRQQRHAFVLFGAAEQFAFRQMLYRLRGRQKPVWLPTFTDDFTVAVAAATGATQLTVEACGYSYVGGPASGRDRIILPDGQIVEVTAAALVGTTQEQLTLATPLVAALAAEARIGFVETARLAQDAVEIRHDTDIDGVASATLSFAAFADRRAATSAVQAIPAAVKQMAACGAPEADNACAVQIFAGWYAEILVQYDLGQIATADPAWIWRENGVDIADNSQPMGPNNVLVEWVSLRYFRLRTRHASSYNVQGRNLQLQFPSGSNPGGLGRARVTVRKWDQALAGTALPLEGSESLGDPFATYQLYPGNWYFNI